jgi:predicted DNA-binding mobile mystery protein A
MSAGALGQRLGMSEAGVRKLEGAEMRNAITLASLQKVAEALDCEVRYALVPRQTLQSTVERRAQQVALQEMRPVAHTMVLEEQGVSAEATSMQVAERVQELLATPSKLWQ